jgi:hypothetical protein
VRSLDLPLGPLATPMQSFMTVGLNDRARRQAERPVWGAHFRVNRPQIMLVIHICTVMVIAPQALSCHLAPAVPYLDYARECPDRVRSLHNFIVFSDHASKILPSRSLIDASANIIKTLVAELFLDGQAEP